jgi:hypothetical protein
MEAGMRVTLDQVDPLVCAERVSARPALAALLPSALVKRTRARLAKKVDAGFSWIKARNRRSIEGLAIRPKRQALQARFQSEAGLIKKPC